MLILKLWKRSDDYFDFKIWIHLLPKHCITVCYLPQNIKGNIIMTTRNERINFGRPFELDVFNVEEAVGFLKRRLSNDSEMKLEKYDFSDFEENSSILAERLGYLPLALEQAAAYIREVRCSINQYLKLLEQTGINAFEDSYASPKYYEHLVTTTWTISFMALEESSRQLMNLCAYMASEYINIHRFVQEVVRNSHKK